GSEAARNVSNLVLLDSNFASMPEIVAEGRRSINNIERSASLFLSKTVYSFLLAVIFLFLQKPFLFEPIQMTLINALCIGAPSFLLALEGNRNAIKGSFIGNVMQKAIPNGLTAVIALSAVMVCGHIYSFTTAQISTLATVVLAFVSFMVTSRCCHPLKMWKIMMMTVLIGGFTFGSIFFSKFFAMTLFNDKMIFCCAVICSSSVAVIVGLSALVKRIAAHIGKKKGTE
ncbi:MAG: cation-translocating P-type ATPase, partial [Ruminiclostridium sp.]|nr:cation-translocating P-type ATPase [Ruminiclostridium sp.]